MISQRARYNLGAIRPNKRRRVGGQFLPTFVLVSLALVIAVNDGGVFARSVGATSSSRLKEVNLLAVGVAVEHGIKGGETHLFGVVLEARQYARIVIKQRSIDLVVTAPMSNQGVGVVHETPAGLQSPLTVSIMATAAGTYTVDVRPVEKWAAAGLYEIQLASVSASDADDEKRLNAERQVAEGRRQQLIDTEDSRRVAIDSYRSALALWHELGDSLEAANTLDFIAQTYTASGTNFLNEAVESYTQALALRGESDLRAKAYARLRLAEVYRDLSDPARALPSYDQSLELFKQLGDRRGQAAALYGKGLAKARGREMREGLQLYEEALRIYRSEEARDRHEEARTLHAMGGAYDVLGQTDQALEGFERALEGWRETGDAAQAGNTYSSIAKLDDDRGDWQAALDNYDKALALYAQGEAEARQGKSAIRSTRASTLYNLGFTYAALGDYSKALDLLKQSLALRDNPAGKGITLMMTGYVQALAGEPEAALESCRNALPLQEEANDPRKSHTFTVMGIAYATRGEHRKALELYAQALVIQQNKDTSDPQAEAITQGRRGESCAALGFDAEALAAYERACQLWRTFGDRNGEALALYGMARVERRGNNLETALKHVEDALAAIEPLRANVTSQQLRVSYFAAKVNYYELYVDLCMRLRDGPNYAARTASALEASERARARSLLDTLSAARVEAGSKSDAQFATLAAGYRRARRQLQSKRAEREQSVREKQGVDALDAEISGLASESEQAEAQLRAEYPRYAALMYPQPLAAEGVQRLLDDDTLLLEFFLGEERSYVWAVTTTELRGYVLPPRAELEGTALRLLKLLKADQPLAFEPAARRKARMTLGDAEYWPLAKTFSETLLGQITSLSKKPRVVVVADGALRYLPFVALPTPGVEAAPGSAAGAPPLKTLIGSEHEVVSLPSASVLSVLRQGAGHKRAPKAVAVFADPVVEKDDSRIHVANRDRRQAHPTAESDAWSNTMRELDDSTDPTTLTRLQASGREARDILAIVPPGMSLEATGFKASYENVVGTPFDQYRVVHFATHGILNEKNPELSGVVLSLYDEQGRFREDGFLRLKDIYGLSLPVDLVVLSACRTALGKEVKGEGLIGLTQGFMYAGAPRVMASLWKVDDDATAELMKRFYQKMLTDGTSPAAALKAAQQSMAAQKQWSSPYYWAGFVLQGDWR